MLTKDQRVKYVGPQHPTRLSGDQGTVVEDENPATGTVVVRFDTDSQPGTYDASHLQPI